MRIMATMKPHNNPIISIRIIISYANEFQFQVSESEIWT